MGNTIWVEVRGRPLMETAQDCGKMLRLEKELDHLAVRLGLPTFSSFFDWSEMALAADAILNETDHVPEIRYITREPLAIREAMGEWFDSGQGMITIRSLRGLLESQPDAIKMPTHSGDVDRYRSQLSEEFRFCEQIVADAMAADRQFRLLIVP